MKDKNKQILWNRAIDLVIGGCGLLSKRPTRYNSKNWPSYYQAAKGIKIQSINKNWYKDFSEFSIGCNIFGYQPKEHHIILRKLRKSPPLTTLLSPEEPYLAEDLNRFFNTNKLWRFTRGGGEALALAIRFARSITKTDKVLVCGYHGWHDWYLATNISSKNNLDQAFLQGLDPVGVPKNLSESTFTPTNLDENSIEKILLKEKIKIIVIEAARYEYLSDEISKLIKKFKKEGGIVVADEVTTGFRVEKKLAINKLGIKPDLLVLGKGLGAGWPIAAVGCDYSHKINLENVFASSTFWTEQSGLLAGRLTIKRLKKWDDFYLKLNRNSLSLRESFIQCFNKTNIDLNINTLATMITYKFKFDGLDERESSALLIDKMVKKGYLTSSTIYPTICHSERENRIFCKNILNSLAELKFEIKNKPKPIKDYLKSLGHLERGFSRTQSL